MKKKTLYLFTLFIYVISFALINTNANHINEITVKELSINNKLEYNDTSFKKINAIKTNALTTNTTQSNTDDDDSSFYDCFNHTHYYYDQEDENRYLGITPFWWASENGFAAHEMIVNQAVAAVADITKNFYYDSTFKEEHLPIPNADIPVYKMSRVEFHVNCPDDTFFTDLGGLLEAAYGNNHFYTKHSPDANSNNNRPGWGVTTNAKDKFFEYYNQAIKDYKNDKINDAFKRLGHALHYFTDLTAPVHSENTTAVQENHGAFEAKAEGFVRSFSSQLPSDFDYFSYLSKDIDTVLENANKKAYSFIEDNSYLTDDGVAKSLMESKKSTIGVLLHFYMQVTSNEYERIQSSSRYHLITQSDYGFEPQYYFYELSKQVSILNSIHPQNTSDLIFDTKRLRTGYIEEEYINLSPRRLNAGVAYLEYKFSHSINQIIIQAAYWSSKDMMQYMAEVQYKNVFGTWITAFDLKANNMSIIRGYPSYFAITFPANTKEFRFYTTADATGTSNGARISIGEIRLFSN